MGTPTGGLPPGPNSDDRNPAARISAASPGVAHTGISVPVIHGGLDIANKAILGTHGGGPYGVEHRIRRSSHTLAIDGRGSGAGRSPGRTQVDPFVTCRVGEGGAPLMGNSGDSKSDRDYGSRNRPIL